MTTGMAHLAWNLLLAWVAVGLAYLFAIGLRAQRARRDARLLPLLVLVGVAWLLMLPNTCYLFTEVRHLLHAIEEHDLWSEAGHSRAARWSLAFRGAVFALYAGVGALTFVLGIRPVRDVVEDAGIRTWAALPLFFPLVALGVYLGLVQRFDSWDALLHPARVLSSSVAALTGRGRIVTVLLGGALLWTVYAIGDVWIDGARLRLARLATRVR